MILVLNGPNLNLLGNREPEIYGTQTLEDLEALCRETGEELQVEVVCRHSNHEGQLIDWLHGAAEEGATGIVFNPGGLAHTSVALRDAIAGIQVPVIEVHLTNVHAREGFRRVSLTAGPCIGTVAGLGALGYVASLRILLETQGDTSS